METLLAQSDEEGIYSEKQKYRLGGKWMERSPEEKDVLRSSEDPAMCICSPENPHDVAGPTTRAAGKGAILPLWPDQRSFQEDLELRERFLSFDRNPLLEGCSRQASSGKLLGIDFQMRVIKANEAFAGKSSRLDDALGSRRRDSPIPHAWDVPLELLEMMSHALLIPKEVRAA
ncbi:hypothetical protein DUI87_04180 [Hirundo rustica rustica]|uniref:Uncharacterized protein n=1 Tax=Hirundo rustica rustica TaxID=333673 RepID=A0A3M0KYH0_HIRRU|nr:hypothetical protein DUI87_04180 [Hirundo rustica rustica]